MFESENRRIAELKTRLDEAIEKKRALEGKTYERNARLNERTRAVARLKQAQDSLKSLQRFSMQSLAASIRGTKNDDLLGAEDELRTATLLHETLTNECKALDLELKDQRHYSEAIARLEADYAAAIASKEQLLERTQQPEQLGTFREKISSLTLQQRELAEAVAAGQVAHEHLQEVVKSLNSAAGWGTWDMLGGGLIATAVKHSRLDDAKANAERAGRACRKFAKELGDVNLRLTTSLEIDSFVKFADYFFDGLFVDWAVQSKIGRAQDQARQQAHEVSTLVARLKSEQETVARQIKAVQREKAEYIASY